MITRVNADVFKPKLYNSVVYGFSSKPSTVKEALATLSWFQEYCAMVQNQTWTLTSLAPGATIMDCKCIFKNNFNDDGTFQRHKACLVAQRFNQTKGLDYSDTFMLYNVIFNNVIHAKYYYGPVCDLIKLRRHVDNYEKWFI